MVEYAVPNEIAGKYEIRGTLGSGAMGTVFDGFDRLIERRVAIKVVRLPPAGDPEGDEARGRFRREAQAAGRLSHPAIVGVYDYGENAETAWIVMELVEGGSLKEPLDRGERMPLPEIVRVMEEALGALAYSHGRGVVHRDIKPANIMLAGDKSVKIADFGIARLENSSMTQVGTVMGTPSYMSPEQLRGEPADLRTDIWAAGVMLYQLLTGEKPFEGGFSAVMHKALNTEPTPPSTLSVTAPRAFDAVISRALAKRPEDRYASALDFAQAIRAASQAPAADSGAGDRFAGAGPLPGLDDATMVSTGTRHPAPPAATAATRPPATPPAPPTGGKSKGPLLAGVAAVVLLAGGGAAWWFSQGSNTAGPGQTPANPGTSGTVPAQPSQPVPGPALPQPTQPLPNPSVPSQPTPTLPTQPSPSQQLPSQTVPTQPAPLPTPLPQTTPALPPTQTVPAPQILPQTVPGLPPAQQTPTPSQQPPAQTTPAQPPTQTTPVPTPPRPVPTPTPVPQAPAAPSRAEITAAARSAVAAAPCALLSTAVDDRRATITGVLRRGGEAALRDALARSGLPADTVRLRVQAFDGPYCELLDALRPLTATPELGPQQLELVDPAPLPRNALIRLNMTMPTMPSQLHLTYVTSGGDAAQLVSAEPQAAGARVRKGDRAPGFTGWEVDEPFGTDLLLAFTADRPLFAQPRPVVEPLSSWLPALEAALRRIRQEGGRVGVRPLVVDTVAQR